jgi:hypothetical protein
MDDLTYEVRLGPPPEPKPLVDTAFENYDPSLPVRMVIKARPKWLPLWLWMKLLKWLWNEDQKIPL